MKRVAKQVVAMLTVLALGVAPLCGADTAQAKKKAKKPTLQKK